MNIVRSVSSQTHRFAAPKRKKRTPMNKRRAPYPIGNLILPAKIFGVSLSESFPLFRQVIQRENRRYWADGNTGSAINALDGVDVQHFLFGVSRRILLRMDAIYRAGVHTSSVLGTDARFCNYVSHRICVSPEMFAELNRTANSNKNPAGGTAFSRECATCRTKPSLVQAGHHGRAFYAPTPPPVPSPRWARTRQCGPPRRSPPRSADWPSTSARAHCGPGNCGSAR